MLLHVYPKKLHIALQKHFIAFIHMHIDVLLFKDNYEMSHTI